MPPGQPEGLGDDGWTVVPRGKGRKSLAYGGKTAAVDKGLAKEKLLTDYNRRMRTWKAKFMSQRTSTDLGQKETERRLADQSSHLSGIRQFQ